MGTPESLVHQIAHWAETTPDRPAQHDLSTATHLTLSWSAYWQRVQAVGRGLLALGHEVGDAVALLGANRPAWVHAQFGIQAARGIVAPIYTTSTMEQTSYIVGHAKAKIAIAGDASLLEKLLEGEKAGIFPALESIITFDPIEHEDPRIMSLDQLIERGADQAGLDERLSSLDPEQTCLLIYTSGTTGTPKGVELSHAGQLMIGRSIISLHPEIGDPGRYRSVSYLPLCHQAEQLFTNIFSLLTGGQVYFCPDLAQIKEYLVEARPTVFLGVPRVWEKFEAALQAKLADTTPARGRLAAWAMKTELHCFKKEMAQGGKPYNPLGRRIGRWLVINKIKSALGMDELEVSVTGSAPIAVSTQEFFASLGIKIMEAYGLSETSGVATVTDFACPKFGTVGKAVPGVSLRISDEGEIQVQGPNNTSGYLHMPEETAELYTEDGWLRTGDLGTIDEEGNVSITGRIKEIIITAGGKNVAPTEMENHIKSIPGVGQAVVVGDRKPYLCALITLDSENIAELRQASGCSGEEISSLASDPAFITWIEGQIEECCNKKVARYQTIKRFEVLGHEFSVEGGELTATMKLRRGPIHEKYAATIEALYA